MMKRIKLKNIHVNNNIHVMYILYMKLHIYIIICIYYNILYMQSLVLNISRWNKYQPRVCKLTMCFNPTYVAIITRHAVVDTSI